MADDVDVGRVVVNFIANWGKLQSSMKAMKKEFNDLQRETNVDSKRMEKSLEGVEGAVDDLGRRIEILQERIRRSKATIDCDTTPILAKLDKVKASLGTLDDEEVKITARVVGDAEKEIDELDRRVDKLDRNDAEIKVTVHDDATEALRRIYLHTEELKHEDVNINVDAKTAGATAKLAAFQALAKSISGGGGGPPGGLTAIPEGLAGLVPILESIAAIMAILGTIKIPIVLAAFQGLLGAVIGLIGGLGALMPVIAGAGAALLSLANYAGVAAFAIAGIGPVIGAVLGSMLGLVALIAPFAAKTIKAGTEISAAEKSAAKASTTGSAARKAGIDAVTQALKAQQQVTSSWAGKILAAELAVAHATDPESKARAERRLADLKRQGAEAEQKAAAAVVQAQSSQAASTDALAQATKDYTKEEIEAYRAVKKFYDDVLKPLMVASEPALLEILKKSLGAIEKLIPLVTPLMEGMLGVLDKLIDDFIGWLDEAENVQMIKDIIGSFVPIFTSLLKVAQPFLKLMIIGWAAALPVAERFVDALVKIGDRWQDLAKGNAFQDKLEAFFAWAEPEFKMFIQGLKAMMGMFKDLAVASRPMFAVVNQGFRDWNLNMRKALQAEGAKKFFTDAIPYAKGLWKWMGNIVKILGDITKAAMSVDWDELGFGDFFGKIRDFTKSQKGQDSLAKFFRDSIPMLREMGKVIIAVTEAVFDLGKSGMGLEMVRAIRLELIPAVVEMIEAAGQSIGPGLVDFMTALGKAFAILMGTSGPIKIMFDSITWFIEQFINLPKGMQYFIVWLFGMQIGLKALALPIGIVTKQIQLFKSVIGAFRATAFASELSKLGQSGMQVARVDWPASSKGIRGVAQAVGMLVSGKIAGSEGQSVAKRFFGLLSGAIGPTGKVALAIGAVAAAAGICYLLWRKFHKENLTVSESAKKLAKSLGMVYGEVKNLNEETGKLEMGDIDFAKASKDVIRSLNELQTAVDKQAFLLDLGWRLVARGNDKKEVEALVKRLAEYGGIELPVGFDLENLDEEADRLLSKVQNIRDEVSIGARGIRIVDTTEARKQMDDLAQGIVDVMGKDMPAAMQLFAKAGDELAAKGGDVDYFTDKILDLTEIEGISTGQAEDFLSAIRELGNPLSTASEETKAWCNQVIRLVDAGVPLPMALKRMADEAAALAEIERRAATETAILTDNIKEQSAIIKHNAEIMASVAGGPAEAWDQAQQDMVDAQQAAADAAEKAALDAGKSAEVAAKAAEDEAARVKAAQEKKVESMDAWEARLTEHVKAQANFANNLKYITMKMGEEQAAAAAEMGAEWTAEFMKADPAKQREMMELLMKDMRLDNPEYQELTQMVNDTWTKSGQEQVDALLTSLSESMGLSKEVVAGIVSKNVKDPVTKEMLAASAATGTAKGEVANAINAGLASGNTETIRILNEYIGLLEKGLNPVIAMVDGKTVTFPTVSAAGIVPKRQNYVYRPRGMVAYAEGAVDMSEEPHIEPEHAGGGMFRIVKYAEVGTGGEAYIPLSKRKRKRSLKLWRKTGIKLGVPEEEIPAYAEGFIDASSVPDSPNFSNRAYGSAAAGADFVKKMVKAWLETGGLDPNVVYKPGAGKGGLAKTTEGVWNFVKALFGGAKWMGGYATDGHVRNSDHYTGHAFDVGGTWAVMQGIANALVRVWHKLPMKQVIFNRQSNRGSGWYPYKGKSPHTDHVHIGTYDEGTGVLQPGHVGINATATPETVVSNPVLTKLLGFVDILLDVVKELPGAIKDAVTDVADAVTTTVSNVPAAIKDFMHAILTGGRLGMPVAEASPEVIATMRKKLTTPESIASLMDESDAELQSEMGLLEKGFSLLLESIRNLSASEAMAEMPKLMDNLADRVARINSAIEEKKAALVIAKEKGWSDAEKTLTAQIYDLRAQQQALAKTIGETILDVQRIVRSGFVRAMEMAAAAVGYLANRMAILSDHSKAFAMIAERMPMVMAQLNRQVGAGMANLGSMIADYQTNMAGGSLTKEQAHQSRLEIIGMANDVISTYQSMYANEKQLLDNNLTDTMKSIDKAQEAYEKSYNARSKALDSWADAQTKALEAEQRKWEKAARDKTRVMEDQFRKETEAFTNRWDKILKTEDTSQRSLERSRAEAEARKNIGNLEQKVGQLGAMKWKTYSDYDAMLQAESELEQARTDLARTQEDWRLEDKRRALEEQRDLEAKALEEAQRLRSEAWEKEQELMAEQLEAKARALQESLDQKQKAIQEEYEVQVRAFEDQRKAAQEAYQKQLDDLVIKYDELMAEVDKKLAGITELWTENGGDALESERAVLAAMVNVPEEYMDSMDAKGVAMMAAFADGITSGGAAAVNALKSIIAQMGAYLPASDAEKGPFSKLTYMGRRMIETFAEGASSRAGALTSVFDTMQLPTLPTVSTAAGGAIGAGLQLIPPDEIDINSTLVIDFRNAPTWVTPEMKQELWEHVQKEAVKLKRRSEFTYGAL